MNKKKTSLIYNILIVLFEIIGIIETLEVNHKIGFEYFTEDSNMLALVSSLLFVLYLIRRKKIPRWLQVFKYMTTICLSITFIVVLFILGPMYKFDYSFLLFSRELFFYHVICPILAFITFTKYDDIKQLTNLDNFIGLTISFVYSTVMIILNLLNKVTGPYPFLKVKEQTISMSIAWGICIFSISYMIALVLRYLAKKNYDKIQRLKHKTKEKVKKIVKRKKYQ